MDSSKVTIGVLIVIVIGLSAYIIFGKSWLGNEQGVDREPVLRDSIQLLINDRLILDRKIDSLDRVNDSLLDVKQTIKWKYGTKIKFIRGASASELDSVIRAAIK